MGLATKGREARWSLPEATGSQLEQVAQEMDNHFAGWTLNDGSGTVKVSLGAGLARRPREGKRERRLHRASRPDQREAE